MTSSTQATANEAKERAADVKDTATQQASEVGGTVKEQTGQVVQEATAQARNLLEEARAQVREQAATQQSRIRQLLEEFADELETMAQAGGRDGIATEVVRQVAARTRSFTTSFGSAEGSDVLESVRTFARRRPGTFLLAASFAGVLAGRATRSAKQIQSAGESQGRRPLGAYGDYGATGAGYPSSGYQAAGYQPGTYETAGYPATGYSVPGTAAGTTAGAEPIITENYAPPKPVTVDLTSVDSGPVDPTVGDRRPGDVAPGDENEWAPVASRSATDRYPDEEERR